MNEQVKEASSGGFGVGGLLGVAFVVLKLCGVINWSWWWVLSPFWIPAAIVLAIFVVIGVGLAIAALIAIFAGKAFMK